MYLKNIGASNKDDAFYRYKMPRMITKTEGCGNGTKTKIVNMVGIAKALSRPAPYLTKYFGYKLGANSEFDEITGAFVNGDHNTTKLNGLLDNFITKYVLCYGCSNPETKIFISISRTTHDPMLSLKCTACGFVSDVNPNDKLTKFILRNTEPKGVSSKESSSKGGAANVATVGGSNEDYSISPRFYRHGGNVDSSHEDENDVKWQTNTSAGAMKQRMHEQLSVSTAEMVLLSINEFFEKEKQGTHKDVAVNGSAKPQNRSNSDGKQTIPDTNPYDELVEEIKHQLRNAATAAELKDLLSTSTLCSQDVMNVLFEALFDGVGKGFAKAVEKNMAYLAALVPDEGHQAKLLQAIEEFGSKCSAAALKQIPFVLRALYCGDVLEEETILQWYYVAVAGGKNSKVLQNAKPFVEGLQNADYESEQE
ncbi:hypothetical protein BDA96_08G106900 [Sorghum bicolor]|uniref:W2 domain-containing protein n=2 Tax=Sorghum bicolor TaxID=4558 RepID=A0A921QF46_SORBI|nr:eukaryotic translation initiation factor 5 [Sorghum bicolor]EES15961.1 hypothetical protein SORBI_3008G095500 [Sorghum bicolor]KAG0520819.1 hypothetical protein BDA96_08G106900 [Sorghum bicolor]|eukprot:XP_002442123.1 eukaryotic translation initiation factor 5 [Sorghum bicolor]